MPTYMLDGTDKVRFPQRPLTVTLRVQGEQIARLGVQREGEEELVPAVQRPDLIVLSRIEGKIIVSVVPVGKESFPPNTVVNIAVVVEDRTSFDPERAVLVPVDVSGLGRRDLISIENIDAALELRAAENYEPETLSPLANAARVITRELWEVHGTGQPTFNVLLALDGSSSVVGLQDDGTFHALIEVVTGMAQVIAEGGRLRAAIVDETSTLLPEFDLATIPRALMETLRDRIPTTGFRISSAQLEVHVPNAEQIVYVLTDSMPADIRQLENWENSSGNQWHIIAATSPSAWQLLNGTTRHTVIEPGNHAQSLESRLLAEPSHLRELLRSLIQVCFRADTQMTGKVDNR
jgi:hypothetical protein